GILSMTLDITNFNCSQLGENTVTLTVIDNNNNEANNTAIVTVQDVTPPSVITQNITVQLDSNGTALISEDAVDNGSSDACGPLTFNTDITSFDCSNLGENSVTLTVSDGSGNEASMAAIVTVQDVTPPNVITQNITVQLDSNGTALISEDAVDNGSSDACGPLASDTETTTFDCSNLGDNSVMLTVSDGSGNEASMTATVTVQDVTPPSVITQNITIHLGSNGTALISEDAVDNGSSDACGPLVFDTDITSFDCSNLGENTVTLTVSDGSGNSSSQTAIVTVIDTIAPTVIASGNISVDADESCNALVTIPDAIISDNCQNNLAWEATGALNTSGSGQIGTLLLPVGITTVTYTNSDDSGNSSLDSISIEVLDITLPSLTTVSDFEVTLSSGCDFTIPDYTDLTSVSDNCGIASISQTPIGNVISGHNTIQEITITATDINGNSNSISFTITLIGNNIYYADVDGDEFGDANNTIISCSIPNGYSENALDCDDNDPTINPNATEIPCNGIDENCNGLADDDTEAPSCLAQDITVELDAETNEASIVFEDIDNGSYDNCGIESTGISPSIFNQSDIGENDVTVTVTDINGNTSTCYIKVTVTESTLSLENHVLESVKFFPNPFYDEVTIKIPKHYPNDKFLVSLLDLTGKKIFDYQFITINNEIKIDNLEKLPQGLYIIKLTDLVTKNHHLLKLIKN
ncbi:MAG TPA: MopE-related protein, partial [Flavobacteriaceae bacterium]|nr:MopE-related protein [Flavobacteriaceae bacterium]